MLNRSNLILAFLWMALVCFTVFYSSIGAFGVNSISLLLSIGSISILILNWYAHDYGRNPSFIFLVLGNVFLCGRAFPVLFGDDSQLATIGFAKVWDENVKTVYLYSIIVLSSFFFVHIGSLRIKQVVHHTLKVSRYRKLYLVLFLLFLQAYIYKNIYYFNYITNEGGYLAIYQGTDHIDGVGFFARFGSLFCLASFTLYFFSEVDKRKSLRALILFLILFCSELLVGLRGKFFVVALVFLLFYKLRFGGKFSIKGLLILLLSIVFLAVIVEITREQKTESIVKDSPFLGFLVSQGVSADVSMVTLDEFNFFSPHAFSYLLHQFFVPFYSQPDVPSGWFLANDLSMLVQPEAFALGFATGSSYLAELILIGGVASVCLGSFFIGLLLSRFGRYTEGLLGSQSFWIVCGLVYYPRTMLQDPIHNFMRYGVAMLVVSLIAWFLSQCRRRGA